MISYGAGLMLHMSLGRKSQKKCITCGSKSLRLIRCNIINISSYFIMLIKNSFFFEFLVYNEDFIGCPSMVLESKQILRNAEQLACETCSLALGGQASNHFGLERVYGQSSIVLWEAQILQQDCTRRCLVENTLQLSYTVTLISVTRTISEWMSELGGHIF
ncbi:hypothetical protein M5K25_009000 [Dendrobium thyrsiflorum]|uniref:Uncharacterized protein n=1 Tax=Dendrobium thyrsiflorum TaxID=117978 RepID=A0ABD0VA00_DENTH